jgi:hypothetical protein
MSVTSFQEPAESHRGTPALLICVLVMIPDIVELPVEVAVVVVACCAEAAGSGGDDVVIVVIVAAVTASPDAATDSTVARRKLLLATTSPRVRFILHGYLVA